MRSFLEEVVDDLLHKYEDISSLIIILPNKRSGNMLLHTLSRKLKKTAFSPRVFSIEDFVAHISGLQSVGQSELLFALYDAYIKTHTKDERESFSTFCHWASTLLYDFNEIDQHLADQGQVFDYLNAVQDINHWSIQEETTTMVTSYLSFWKKIPLLYRDFCERLLESGKGYSGLIYRKAAEDIEYYIANNTRLQHVFVGFNALNKAEEHIIQALLTLEHNTIYWDIDNTFFENSHHQAAHFLKTHKAQWPYFKTHSFNWISDHYRASKNVYEIAIPDDISQVNYIGHLLKDYNENRLASTAIILANEALLVPMLSALPKNVKTLNVTMGIPLLKTPLGSFFEHLFKMHKNKRDKGFYYKDVLTVLNQPQTKRLLKKTGQDINAHLVNTNTVYISYAAIQKLAVDQPLVIPLFDSWQISPDNAINSCLSIAQALQYLYAESGAYIEQEYAFGFYKVFNQLHVLNANHSHIDTFDALYLFYRDALNAEKIDLKGSPYQGLQIMGLLESRLLDFETVIVASVNEGILPSGKTYNSYLPFDLKLAHKLPTYQEKDAVYAYHFYRLLQRAKDVHLCYTLASDGVGSAEKSRFLMQLSLENIHKIEVISASPLVQAAQDVPLVIEKTPEILDKIAQLATSGFSPSSLATYIRSPLAFYYTYILGIREQEQIEESLAANTIGTIIHNTLETLYAPFVEKQLLPETIDILLSKMPGEIDRQYEIVYKNRDYKSGKNRIIYEVISRYITNYLKQEKGTLQKGINTRVIAVERALQTSLLLKDIPYNILLKGKVDLMIERNGIHTIIDYKTGSISSSSLVLKDWGSLTRNEGKYEKAFQVLAYAYMVAQNTPKVLPMQAGIIPLKNTDTAFIPFRFNKDSLISGETLAHFDEVLKALITEICDSDIPITEKRE